MHTVKRILAAGKNLEDAPKSGRPQSVRTERRVAAVPAKIAQKPDILVRRLSKAHRTTHATMHRIVHEAMGLHSHVAIPQPLFMPNVRKKYAERALKLLFRLKGRDATIIDKKIVT